MKALIDNRPFPVCILRSGDPARDHSRHDVAETFARNTPPIQHKVGDDYDDVERDDWLSAPGEFA